MEERGWRHHGRFRDHMRNKENNIDPDDGKSWVCSACNLPIFSTPYKTYADHSSKSVLLLHDECANLPKELKGSVLHPGKPLLLHENLPPNQIDPTPFCHKCGEICGTMFYYCPDRVCYVDLDVLCAGTSIKILHRSHEHRLMAIRGVGLSNSLICGSCGTQHQAHSALSYICHACGFWIHPHCASLPNIILLHHANHQHHHPLLLNYRRPDSSKQDQDRCYCEICGGIIESLGIYSCTKCCYYVHIMCAVSDPQSFKPVSIREARLPDLVRLPIPDEHTSLIRYITDSTSIGGTTSNSSSDHHDELLPQELHEHPLIFHDHYDDDDDDDDDDDYSRVCNACVQFISPPFYSCSECPDFFLHNCCAHLPRTLTQHPAHKQHPLSLFPKFAYYPFLPIFSSNCCNRPCNGFSYCCRNCNFDMDVLCALMPASITHNAHSTAHILYLSVPSFSLWDAECHCCNRYIAGICYECGTCRYFRLHVWCALLPDTVRHRFDQHSLKLITTTSIWSESSSTNLITVPSLELKLFCEVCEGDIDNRKWYYSCDKCDQSFHIGCIPCLGDFSRIKFGATVIRVQCHDCPLTLILGHKVCGYRCGYCGKKFTDQHKLAFECSKCYFRMHGQCAHKCLLKVKDVD